jgi:hypothetical protein
MESKEWNKRNFLRNWADLLMQRNWMYTFLDALAKFRKATVSFVMFVRPSVRMEQLGSQKMDFHEIWYVNIHRKFVEKIRV